MLTRTPRQLFSKEWKVQLVGKCQSLTSIPENRVFLSSRCQLESIVDEEVQQSNDCGQFSDSFSVLFQLLKEREAKKDNEESRWISLFSFLFLLISMRGERTSHVFFDNHFTREQSDHEPGVMKKISSDVGLTEARRDKRDNQY